MGCSPSVLLEHIHRDSSSDQEKALKKSAQNYNKKDTHRLLQRKSSPALSPEDELHDSHKAADFKYGQLAAPKRSPLRVLLVFSTQDQFYETLHKAAEKLTFDVSSSSSEEEALDDYQAKYHDLVIIDSRSPRTLEYDLLCRSIRNARGSQHSILVATVKKNVYEKDETVIPGLLEMGYNRVLVETSNITACVNELVQLKLTDVRSQAQSTAVKALYTAIDKCRDLIMVTDDAFKLQYVNRASEKLLVFRADELVGKNFQEQLVQDSVQMNPLVSSFHRGKEYSGPMTLKRKTFDPPFQTTCKSVPVTCLGKTPTHCVLLFDAGLHLDPSTQRGSIHSIKRGSVDMKSLASDHARRTSLAKLNALPLEAPITKLIGLIEAARDSSGSPQVISYLDKVEDMIRNSELYSPQVKDDAKVKADEPIVSDLITALLSKQPTPMVSSTSRRSSNDSAIYRPARTSVLKVSTALKELLENSLSWEFDIFRLEDLTKKRPLQNLGMSIFLQFDAANVLNCDEKTLYNWLTIIEANYHSDNFYHNSTHAADVMQATGNFLQKERLKSIMEPMDEITCLVAAAGHDVDHPGKSSAFLSNSDNPLAILYNDLTVLESHHSALTFKLTLGDERVNIFKNLDRETYKIARHNIIDMILATEMTKHFEHLAKFVNVFCTKPSGSDSELNLEDIVQLSNPENITLIKRMMIKCADVSNPTRPLRLCLEWAIRIAEEYFQQTDEEKMKGLPVVMPMFDRGSCSIPKSQIGFVDYIINDMMEAWNAFIDMPELTNHMRINYIKWKEFDENGHISLADLEKLKRSMILSTMQMAKKKPGD